MPTAAIATRVHALDWNAIERSLWEHGYALSRRLLMPEECRALIRLYRQDERFRSRVDMARHRFGVGDYAYFAEPLPDAVAALRSALYAQLAPIANSMMEALRLNVRYPLTLTAYRRQCRAAGQRKPTPLLLHYTAGGFNCLHRDLYGRLRFPLQATLMLSRPGSDFAGGEFLLVENRPRQQSRGHSITLQQGDAVIFPVAERPVTGTRGVLRAGVRHGVSAIQAGERYTLGIIFHDAE